MDDDATDNGYFWPSEMTKVEKTVDRIMHKQLDKNKDLINNCLIQPLDMKNYQFSTNGVYFLCGKMGSGKSYFIMKHIMLTERLFKEPYYDTIVFTSTSGSLDKTVSSMQPQVKTNIKYVSDTDLVPFLEKHINNKMKFYSVMEFLNHGTISELLEHIVKKYNMIKMIKGKKVIDMKRLMMYTQAKMNKYGFSSYPTNTLLVCDDFAGHPLLKKIDSPLARMMTKTRHYHLTVIICAQTWRFINLNLKRLCSDLIIYKGFSQEDFKHMLEQTPSSQNWKTLWPKYSSMPSPHSKMIVHCITDQIEFEDD